MRTVTTIVVTAAALAAACARPAAPATTPAGPPEVPAAGAEHPRLDPAKVVDLTHPMRPDMPFWPGGVPFTMTRLVDYDHGYRLHKFEMGENTGTHLDAPVHFAQGREGRAVADIPIADLIVPAVVIDVRERVAADPDFQLSADDVRAWEGEHGAIPRGSLVILDTGWHVRFSDAKQYINMGEDEVMHFPGFGVDSAELLVARDVAGIGIDTLSLDHGPSQDFATHTVMLAANKYQIENMANLDALPPTGATVIIGVLPVVNGTQAQARIFALLP